MTINNLLLIKKGDVIEENILNNTPYTFTPTSTEPLDCVVLLFNEGVDVTIDLKEEESSCSIKVLYLANQKDKLNINIRINHWAYNTKSSQIIKGIATDESVVNFNGNIYIDQKAQKTDGSQNHRALLLSDDAFIQSVPALEIYADDVKCSHGSATGPLDSGALFYLMSRGISLKTAKEILLSSFIADMLPDGYQELTNKWIETNV